MKIFCQVAIETVEVESIEVLLETWRERRGGRIVLTKDINRLEDGEDDDKA